jgi:hypothetical protein
MPFISGQDANIRRFLDYKRRSGAVPRITLGNGNVLEGAAAEEYARRYGSGQTEFERAKEILAQEGSQAQTLEGLRQKGSLKEKEMDVQSALAAIQGRLEQQRLANRGSLNTEQLRQTGESERAVLRSGTARDIAQKKADQEANRLDPRGFEYGTDMNGNITSVYYMGRPYTAGGTGVPGNATGERVNPTGLASRVYDSGIRTPTSPSQVPRVKVDPATGKVIQEPVSRTAPTPAPSTQRSRRKIVVDPATGTVTQEPTSSRGSGGLLNRGKGGGFFSQSIPVDPAKYIQGRLRVNNGEYGSFRQMGQAIHGATSYLNNTFYQPAKKAFRFSMKQLGY